MTVFGLLPISLETRYHSRSKTLLSSPFVNRTVTDLHKRTSLCLFCGREIKDKKELTSFSTLESLISELLRNTNSDLGTKEVKDIIQAIDSISVPLQRTKKDIKAIKYAGQISLDYIENNIFQEIAIARSIEKLSIKLSGENYKFDIDFVDSSNRQSQFVFDLRRRCLTLRKQNKQGKPDYYFWDIIKGWQQAQKHQMSKAHIYYLE